MKWTPCAWKTIDWVKDYWRNMIYSTQKERSQLGCRTCHLLQETLPRIIELLNFSILDSEGILLCFSFQLFCSHYIYIPITSNPYDIHLISIAISYYCNLRGKLCPIQTIQKNNQWRKMVHQVIVLFYREVYN